ncbi:unnamed protein product [marine sediment metagenome]|uniref:Nudix hydrolase domain-containing protein n=1 Tax=marine sediment metagenome TaxID=412755 RepID=X1B925_9ZZZZ
MPAIHLLGRVALISNAHILLAHEIRAKNTFLPGGHIEYNEPAKTFQKSAYEIAQSLQPQEGLVYAFF